MSQIANQLARILTIPSAADLISDLRRQVDRLTQDLKILDISIKAFYEQTLRSADELHNARIEAREIKQHLVAATCMAVIAKSKLATLRDEVIEECAQVAETIPDRPKSYRDARCDIAALIRTYSQSKKQVH